VKQGHYTGTFIKTLNT